MVEASRPKQVPRPVAARVAARQLSPNGAKAVVAAAVLEDVSTASGVVGQGKSGQPDDPGKMFYEIHDWNRDHDGIPYYKKGFKL